MSTDFLALAQDIALTGSAAVAKAERAALDAVAREQGKSTVDLFEDAGVELPAHLREAADRVDAMAAHPTARPKLTLHQGGADA